MAEVWHFCSPNLVIGSGRGRFFSRRKWLLSGNYLLKWEFGFFEQLLSLAPTQQEKELEMSLLNKISSTWVALGVGMPNGNFCFYLAPLCTSMFTIHWIKVDEISSFEHIGNRKPQVEAFFLLSVLEKHPRLFKFVEVLKHVGIDLIYFVCKTQKELSCSQNFDQLFKVGSPRL